MVKGLLQWWQVADSLRARQTEKGDCSARLGMGIEHKQLPPQSENPEGQALRIFWCVVHKCSANKEIKCRKLPATL